MHGVLLKLKKMLPRWYWTLFILVFLTYLLSFFLPVYTDEITFRFMQTRYFLNHHELLGASAECLSSFHRRPPVSWLPAVVISSLLYDDLTNPLKLRVLGVLSYLFWLVLFSFFLIKIYKVTPRLKSWVLLSTASVVSVGVLPFLMVINRPEQALLLGATFLVLLPLLKQSSFRIGAKQGEWGYLGVFLFASASLFYFHPKTVFFTPSFLVFIYYLFQSWRVRGVAAVSVLEFLRETLNYSKASTACPENPRVNEIIGSAMMTPQDFTLDFTGAITKFSNNLINLKEYVVNLHFQREYVMSWLPAAERPTGNVVLLVNFGITLLCVLILSLVVLGLSRHFYQAVKYKKISFSFLMLLTLFGTRIVFYGLRTSKPFYDDSLEYPLLILMLVLSYQRDDFIRWKKFWFSMSLAVVLLAGVSQLVLIKRFYPSANNEWILGGAMPSQEFSISAFHFEVQNEKTRALAKLCQIPLDESGRHIVIDDLTYPALWKTYRPQPSLFTYYYNVYLGSTRAILKYYDSSGVITKCSNFPKDLRPQAKVIDNLCCIGRDY